MPRRRVPVFAVLLAILVAGVAVAPGYFSPAAARQATPDAVSAACPAATAEENEALVRRFYEEAWSQGNLGALDELLTDDFVVDIPRAIAFTQASQTSPGGRANLEAAIEQLRTDFPDLRVRVDELVADGETVALRMTWTGTQADDLEPWGAPDTGRPMARVSASFVQVACGRIAGVWTLPDNLSMLRQLGVVSDAELRTVDTPTVATPAP